MGAFTAFQLHPGALNSGDRAMTESATEPKRRKRMTGEKRKLSIAETTVEMIAQYGVRGATTARIAAAEGISERALYKYFTNRREMLIEAHKWLLERANRSLHDQNATNAIEYLRAAAQLHWPSEEEFAYPLFEFFACSPLENLRGYLKASHEADVELISQIVEDGKRQGVISPDVDSKLAAWEFWAVCWAQDLAYVLGFDDFGSSGLSSRMIERFLESISSQVPAAAVPLARPQPSESEKMRADSLSRAGGRVPGDSS